MVWKGERINELRRSTITSLEVAEMMVVSHNDILRKLDEIRIEKDIFRL
mgnify:CR=1 FL=1